MTNIKIFFYLVFIAFLSSCATNQVVFNKDINHDTNILVISDYSDTLHIEVIGSTIFGNGMKDLENFGISANKTILKHLSEKEASSNFIPYTGDINLYKLDLQKNQEFFINAAKDFNCQFVLLITDGVYKWDGFFGEYKGFGIKRRKNFGQQFTFKYAVIKANLIDTNTINSVGTVTKIKQTKIHVFPNEKMDELDRERFDIFKYGFDSLLTGAIDKILLEMEI